jgi:hypothetical protein
VRHYRGIVIPQGSLADLSGGQNPLDHGVTAIATNANAARRAGKVTLASAWVTLQPFQFHHRLVTGGSSGLGLELS